MRRFALLLLLSCATTPAFRHRVAAKSILLNCLDGGETFRICYLKSVEFCLANKLEVSCGYDGAWMDRWQDLPRNWSR